MVKRCLFPFLLLLACCAGASAPSAQPQNTNARPRLVVVISIDQFRADYLPRFSDLYLPSQTGDRVGGFKYLRARGAWYADCQYQHHRTVTAAGHSILGTGAQPYESGIVGNSWWNRATGRSTYCVADPKSQVVGASMETRERPMSAANQLATTVGDELELATGGEARTVSLSLKDRAAILMAGHRADTVIWFDEDTGGWISSTAYCKDGKLPAWVDSFNARKVADRLRERAWEPAVGEAALRRVWNPKGGPVTFSHALTGKDYVPFGTSPSGNAFVFETAREAVTAEKLGQDEVPDILTLNLASNDYVGHRYGPDSAEVVDISVQTDRQLSDFFNFLKETVPGGLSRVTLALSADHGVATVPELNAASGVPASRAVAPQVQAAAEKALDTAVGPADWIGSMDNGEIYFQPAAVAKFPREPRARLERLVCDAVQPVAGVYLAIGKSAVLAGQVPQTEMGRRISLGVHPNRSGDVILILDPHWLAGGMPIGTGTSHGTPFAYDAHVPLLMAGAGVRSGLYSDRVGPAQLAPTLSHILGVARPSAADEPLLPGLAGTER